MQCKVAGCTREAHYKAAQLCAMHYHRLRRSGTYGIKKAKPRIEDRRGYQFLHAPTHPLLAKGQIYVAEHRIVLYAAIGPGPMCCALCGKALTWATCDVDHIDENPRNNERSNLRPLCLRCNVWRSMPPAHERIKNAIAITYCGETKTPNEWAKDPRVSVSGGQIRSRKKAGMSDEQALFAPKVTHNGNVPKQVPRKTQHKHERKNAVRIEIDGVVATAAEWARHPGCTVGDRGLIWRVKNGWGAKDAVFKAARNLLKAKA